MSMVDDDMGQLRDYLRRRDQRPLPDGSVDRVISSVVSGTRTPQRPRRVMALAVGALTAGSLAAVLGVSLWAGHAKPAAGRPHPQPAVVASTPTPSATPEPSPTVTPGPTPSARPAAFPLNQVAWASVNYGFDCGGFGYRVGQVSYAPPVADKTLAIVLVTCDAGAGSPPAALFVFDGATSATTPHLSQTLLAPSDNWLANGFRVSSSDNAISVAVHGYSSSSRPRCCPDITATLTWAWHGVAYEETGSQPSHQQL